MKKIELQHDMQPEDLKKEINEALSNRGMSNILKWEALNFKGKYLTVTIQGGITTQVIWFSASGFGASRAIDEIKKALTKILHFD